MCLENPPFILVLLCLYYCIFYSWAKVHTMSSQAVKQAAKSPYGGEKTWTQYMVDVYHQRKPPTLGTLYMDELEQKAKEKLKGYPSE